MISLSLKSLAEVLGVADGGVVDATFRDVTIDSRTDCEGKLFVAIKGDNFDGHKFVETAFRNGAVVALVETRLDCGIAQLVVEDCKLAMGKLANYWRRYCDPCVIALTGSNGKTTVKEMLYQVLSRQAPTLATRGNFNNDIGLPLTLFRLEPTDKYAVIEMGANHRGEIAGLAEIAQPDVVYINNVAAAHLAGFGSIQGVIEAKGEIYAYCGPRQRALFNADEVASGYWRSIVPPQPDSVVGLINRQMSLPVGPLKTSRWKSKSTIVTIDRPAAWRSSASIMCVMHWPRYRWHCWPVSIWLRPLRRWKDFPGSRDGCKFCSGLRTAGSSMTVITLIRIRWKLA